MPELPEVQTTVNGLRKHIVGLRISLVWSNYASRYFTGSETIKDPAYFAKFKKMVMGARVSDVSRRAKNVLITLDNGTTVLVHMKMTGHLLFGIYRFRPTNIKDPWEPVSPPALKDPYNRHVHFILQFSNKKCLALSDVRKFAKVTAIETKLLHQSEHLRLLGPEPLDKKFTLKEFAKRLDLRKGWKIKQALTDQTIMAGIGNIYADESLWRAGIHPMETVKNIGPLVKRKLYDAVRTTLLKGIDLGGDSMSDYRNVYGEKGEFQEKHKAYRRTGTICEKKNCGGKIIRIMVGGRSTHLCNKHQKLGLFSVK